MDRSLCRSCVYYVKNLPKELYPEDEWEKLERLECSIEASPGDEICNTFRKSSCSLIDLDGGSES